MTAPIDTKDLHARLLDLHKVLLDLERAAYERENGKVSGPGEMLQLVTQHAAFAWLRPLSMLLVELDDDEVLARAGGPRALVEAMLRPGNVFYDRYVEVLKANPSVAPADAAARNALKALPV